MIFPSILPLSFSLCLALALSLSPFLCLSLYGFIWVRIWCMYNLALHLASKLESEGTIQHTIHNVLFVSALISGQR